MVYFPPKYQERILSSLEEVFEEVQNSEGVAEVDMPDVEVSRRLPEK